MPTIFAGMARSYRQKARGNPMKKTVLLMILFGMGWFLNILNAQGTENVEIHGLVSQGYLKTDHNNYLAKTEDGTFEFNELALNFNTEPVERLRLGVQFFARDLGDTGNDEITLDWAVADYRWHDYLGFRVGRIRTTFGYYKAVKDFDMLRIGVFAPSCVYPEVVTETSSSIRGLSFYGNLTGGFGSFSYDCMAGLPDVAIDSELAHAQENFWAYFELKATQMTADNSWSFDYEWETPFPGLMLGGTYYHHTDFYLEGTLGGPASEKLQLTALKQHMDLKGYFLTLRYTLREAVFLTEFLQNTIVFDVNAERAYDDPPYYKAESMISQGWYAGLSYRFSPLFEAEYKYSVYYPDINNKDGKATFKETPLTEIFNIHIGQDGNPIPKLYGHNEFEAWKKTSTFSFRFDLNEFWLFKLEAAYNDGFGDYNTADNGDGTDLKRYWWLYAAKVTYNF